MAGKLTIQKKPDVKNEKKAGSTAAKTTGKNTPKKTGGLGPSRVPRGAAFTEKEATTGKRASSDSKELGRICR